MRVGEAVSYITSGLSIFLGPIIGAPLLIVDLAYMALNTFKASWTEDRTEKDKLKEKVSYYQHWAGMNALRCIPVAGGIAACILQNKNSQENSIPIHFLGKTDLEQKFNPTPISKLIKDRFSDDLTEKKIKNVVILFFVPSDATRNVIIGREGESQYFSDEQWKELQPSFVIFLPSKEIRWDRLLTYENMLRRASGSKDPNNNFFVGTQADFAEVVQGNIPESLSQRISEKIQTLEA